LITHLHPGTATAIGSLPHIDPSRAARFALEQQPRLPAIPSLPRRSMAESILGQAAVGVRGVSINADGSLAVDIDQLDPSATSVTDINSDSFVGLRTFLDVARGRTMPVKWQVTGPVTFGLALVAAGAPADLAFEVARVAVRSRALALHATIAAALPGAAQVVFVDEPSFGAVMHDRSPLAPDLAVDLVSGALAALEPLASTGVHCCGDADVAALIAAGPSVLSIPARRELQAVAGYLNTFLESGGWVAWGAVATNQPIGSGVDPWWRELAGIWCDLVGAGCDPVLLRRQSLLTPECGLAGHHVEQAKLVYELTNELSGKVSDQAVATRLNVGA
jgi:hypothetical protein